jgi:predicted  nucleic acid-binding Zn-ribbon protein
MATINKRIPSRVSRKKYPQRGIKALVLKVNELTGEVEALTDCIIELNETLEKQNEWLKELCDVLGIESAEADEEYAKEREEFEEHLEPVNAPHKMGTHHDKRRKS